MPPNSRPVVNQNGQPPQAFIIRTRSQQQQPLNPVDMIASPMKEALRHRRNLNAAEPPPARFSRLREVVTATAEQTENVEGMAQDEASGSSQRKRSSSPSFQRSDSSEKRIKILGNSSKTAGAVPTTPSRVVSYGSPSKGTPFLDLSKVTRSPSKQSGTPAKMLKITTDTGLTMRVPMTPGRMPQSSTQ
ncbi:hypothetical protein M422DRAFT_199583, partial [Sphaerobolus stellatus SS14]